MRSHFFGHAHSHLRLHRSPPITSSPTSPTSLRHPATPHPFNPRPNPLASNPSSLAVPSISILPPTPTPTRRAFPQARSSSSSVSSVESSSESRLSMESTRSLQSINSVLTARRAARGQGRPRGLGSFEEDVEGIMEPRGAELEGAYAIVGIGEVLSERLG